MRLSLILAFSLVAQVLSAQTTEILHSKGKLDWANYAQKPATHGNIKAFTYAGVSYFLRQSGTEHIVQFQAYVNVNDSWVLEGAASKSLLEHEQGIFDLTEVYARKMKKAAMALIAEQGPDAKFDTLLPLIRGVYRELNNELFQQQNMYNVETRNGNDLAAQKRWNEKISSDLKVLEPYKSDINA
jgi:hypothetical protein